MPPINESDAPPHGSKLFNLTCRSPLTCEVLATLTFLSLSPPSLTQHSVSSSA